jgi:hypothetical protein
MNTPAKYTSQRTPVEIATIALDMVLYGDDDLVGVLETHALTEEELLHLMDDPHFVAEMRRVNTEMATPHGAIKVQSLSMLYGHVATVNSIASDTMEAGATRLRAISQLAAWAGLGEEDGKTGGGPMVNISFTGITPTNTVIEVNRDE